MVNTFGDHGKCLDPLNIFQPQMRKVQAMRFFFYTIPVLFLFLMLTQAGCNKEDQNVLKTVYNVIAFNLSQTYAAKFTSWKAEKFFDDPKIIALCKAIEAENMAEFDRLIDNGADVNTRGKGNMTPLLWAFHEGDIGVFKKLLEHGADPNVKVTSRFNTKDTVNRLKRAIFPGDSVLFLAAQTDRPDYFKYVMQHGGNPNLLNGDVSLLMAVMGWLCPDKNEAIQLLIDAGVDLEYRSSALNQTALEASVHEGVFHITLQLLEAGASFNNYSDVGRTVVHYLVGKKQETMSPEEKKAYTDVIAWLDINGADLAGAKMDNENWKAAKGMSPQRLAELKKRYEDERVAKQAAKAQEAAPVN